jgi:hypothetical protein
MKKIPLMIPFAALIVILSCLSCASASPTPQPAERQPSQAAEQAPPPQPAERQPSQEVETIPHVITGPEPNQFLLDELANAIARAEEARKRATDFLNDSYFPNEWEEADALHSEAKSLPVDTEGDIHKAVAAFNATADVFDSVFKLAIPLYAQAREDEIMEYRNRLVSWGIKDSFPEVLLSADETALLAFSQYEAENYYAARDTAANALQLYIVMEKALRAWLVRQEIREREFEGYAPDDFDSADGALVLAVEAYENREYSLAFENASIALEKYETVLHIGWIGYTEKQYMIADAEREAAIEIKANVAARDLFVQADLKYKSALDIFYKTSNFKKAAKEFIETQARFILATVTASEKRSLAIAAIKEAEEKIEDSDITGRQAEILIEGGSQ